VRMLDLFCGRWGWSKAFTERGWECVGVDLVEPPEIPEGCEFMKQDILQITADSPFMHWDDGTKYFDFICASSPCEQFSVHGMKHFHPNPKYPELGIKLFNHTRSLCEASGVPYVMENVRAAQEFVGRAVNHCGPFFLWGSAVPPLMPQGVKKGNTFRGAPGNYMKFCPPGMDKKTWRNAYQKDVEKRAGGRRHTPAFAATIPPLLAAAVADYATRLYKSRVA
jgi:hypothetical protein